MTAVSETDLLVEAENAILETVSQQGDHVMAADVIDTVSRKQPPAVVREAYWQLISDNRIARSADGRLSRSKSSRV